MAGAVCRCESPASAYGIGWQRTLAKDFKLEHAGVPGRLLAGPNGVKESAINVVADVPLMTACGTHENTVAGPESCRRGAAGGTPAWVTRSAGWRARAASRPEWSQESAADVVADVSLMTAVRDTWNIPSLGQCPGRQSVGSGRDSCSGGAMRLEDGPCGRPARVESRVSITCGRRTRR